jgi:hypothetical protein
MYPNIKSLRETAETRMFECVIARDNGRDGEEIWPVFCVLSLEFESQQSLIAPSFSSIQCYPNPTGLGFLGSIDIYT